MKEKKSLIYFGTAAGIINIFGWCIFNLVLGSDPSQMDFEKGEVIGYTAMILSFTMIYFGVRHYRDKKQEGIISFKNAFLNGLVIVLVASLIYVVGWEIYYPNFQEQFAEQYGAHLMAKLEEDGLSAEEIRMEQQKMDQWMENYNNPFIRIGITFMEIFPIGLIIALFTALILKKNTK